MKFSFGQKKWDVPSDEEIERDVDELRQLLRGIDPPPDPHPAYWQNFLVRVHERVDGDRFRRRGWAPSMAWASMTAAALVVVLAVSGVIPTAVQKAGTDSLALKGGVESVGSAGTGLADQLGGSHDALAASGEPLLFEEGSRSLILSKDDVRMLKAIMSEDDNDILRAMVESETL